MDKIFITAEQLLRDSFRLAAQIYMSGFRPDFIAGIWRGGTPVGTVVQEYFEYRGVTTDHIAIKTQSYTGIDSQSDTVRVLGLEYLVDSLNTSDSLLIVDDVFDSGRSVHAVLSQLEIRMRRNMPSTVRIACPWYKPTRNRTPLHPDYFLHETDAWLVFPHELCGVPHNELVANKRDLTGLWDELDGGK
ncbi:MAG: hypoxanthine phosphoribosyltransferase [Gammaproteobacteria bacterium]|nr:hypoxanthine phosphoribosyltransferase [Gammaproteobacteria bacterium]